MDELTDTLTIIPYTFDDDIINAVLGNRKPRFKGYIPEAVAVVLGRGGKPETELKLDACIADHVPVFRRYGGGGAVVIDPGNIVISVALPTTGIAGSQRYFDRLSQWLIEKLEMIGINGIHRGGISDLIHDGRKIGGSCIHRTQNYLYYSATLLFEPRTDLMERYLKHPPREPEYRKRRPHADFVGALPLHSLDMKAEELLEHIKKAATAPQLSSLL